MKHNTLDYVNYFPTLAEAEAAIKSLPFGGEIEIRNGWFHVWANR